MRRLLRYALPIFAGGLAVAATAYLPARAYLLESRAKTYRATLAAEGERIAQWIAGRRATARHIATNPELRTLAEQLVDSGAVNCQDETERSRRLNVALVRHMGADAPRAAHIARADGTILASLYPGYCGKSLGKEVIARLRLSTQRGLFLPPIREANRIEGMGADDRPAMVWFEAPINDIEGGRVAYFGYGLEAGEQFRALFAARSKSVAVMAFAANGSTLSGPTPAGSPWLTEAISAASDNRDAHGETMRPYPGSHGRETVAAWRWQSRDGLGMAMEIDADEAFRPLWPIQATMIVCALLLIVSAALQRYFATNPRGGPPGPKRIGPYQIDGVLGEGTISTVYRATHPHMKREVAIKVLRPHAASDELVARFRREVQLTHALKHPNFVRLYDFGDAPGVGFYCAMEYVAGLTFAELVEKEGPQPPARVAHLLREVCLALAEAHDAGLLHRDIKPQNLMLAYPPNGPDVVKILDFGLVKKIDGDPTRDLTRHVNLLGTLAYLAPERITDPTCTDHRSELYALGAVGFFMLSGQKPFESASEVTSDPLLTHRILHETAPRVGSICPFQVPDWLEELIERCLAKNPAQRPDSAAAMAAMLTADGNTDTTSPENPVAASDKHG